MTTFDKREEGFEKKFVVDEELKFKAEARRNKLLGLWAAEKLDLSGDVATAYARDVVAADFEEAGDGVFRKVTGDLGAKGLARPGGRVAGPDERIDGTGHRAGEGGEIRRRLYRHSGRRAAAIRIQRLFFSYRDSRLRASHAPE